MQRVRLLFRLSMFFLVLLLSMRWGVSNAVAETPPRQTTITVSFTEYEWWLISWEDNSILCQLFLDHEGLPVADDVETLCSEEVYAIWETTPSCNTITSEEVNTSKCAGVYMHMLSYKPQQKEIIIDLPSLNAYLTLEGCDPNPPENFCPTIPNLLITGEEPLPNENIVAIEGVYDGMSFSCPSSVCAIPLQSTPMEGAMVEFWGVSSFGDSSEHFTAKVRVIDTGVSTSQSTSGYFVDVLSSQWRGESPASCSQTWDTFPPVGGPPDWLSTPEEGALIASDQPYYYLAGRLISQGLVDASSCPTGGLLPNGYANACGLELARPIVQNWQNQFDNRIIQVAQETGIPAQVMKNIFAQESQFWPGMFKVPYEFGLGQITENGADTILLWDENFYNQFCPLILLQEACDTGYLHLQENNQAILRGALALQAKSDCEQCTAGIDLSNVDFSLSLFANTIKANCDQVGQIVYNAAEDLPGAVCTYEDLWRFVIANYHTGPGCLSYAIYMAWINTGELTWENVIKEFTDPCKGVIPYVEKIAR
jgi:hypothetical protein